MPGRYEICSVLCGGSGPEFPEFPNPNGSHVASFVNNTQNQLSPCQAYQQLLQNSDSELLFYVHDDVTIHDPAWKERVLAVFNEHPQAAVVGFGGAFRLGRHDLYKHPYELNQMAREGYVSNQRDWRTHGGRIISETRVAVVDAFFMAVDRQFLVRAGGWPVCHLSHHCLDLWVCCEATRQNREVYMTGVDCTHHGGGSSTTKEYKQAAWLQGGSLETDHQLPHRWLYDLYPDVLPISVPVTP